MNGIKINTSASSIEEAIIDSSEPTVIKYYRKQVYGNTWYYPACYRAELFARISGKATLSLGIIRIMEDLGFKTLEVLQSQSEL